MNRLAQFLQYTQKLFELKRLLRSVRDGRSEPVIPIQPVVLCLVLGVVTRISSYLDLAQQTKSRRGWGIENKAFNELTQGYHLEHCYHHEPTSMLVQMLILAFGFTLFTAFALHSQLVRVGELTLKALANELNLGLEEDLAWSLWFHSG